MGRVVSREKVYEHLMGKIHFGEMRAGDRILEETVAEEMQMSRTPVREAIRHLEKEGIVEHIAHVGTFVKRFSLKEIMGNYDLRAIMEGYAARLLASIITDEQVGELEKNGDCHEGSTFPTAIHPFCATVELMSSMYQDQQTAIYMLHDHRDIMEELFDLHWKVTQRWLEVARRLDVDIYHFAVNGLEWLSLDIYERYMIPQAKRIADFADSAGKLSWIHTCGKKAGLIERDVYRRMGVKVVESLSAPPDRRHLGLRAGARQAGRPRYDPRGTQLRVPSNRPAVTTEAIGVLRLRLCSLCSGR